MRVHMFKLFDFLERRFDQKRSKEFAKIFNRKLTDAKASGRESEFSEEIKLLAVCKFMYSLSLGEKIRKLFVPYLKMAFFGLGALVMLYAFGHTGSDFKEFSKSAIIPGFVLLLLVYGIIPEINKTDRISEKLDGICFSWDGTGRILIVKTGKEITYQVITIPYYSTLN